VEARITITVENGGWLGRSSSPADGDFELHLRLAGPGLAGGALGTIGVPMAGTLRGVGADHSRPSLFPHDARVVARGIASSVDAQLVGEVSNGVGGIGSVDGVLTYTDNAGASTTCLGGTWILLRALPGS
jgi:hypothetical protein